MGIGNGRANHCMFGIRRHAVVAVFSAAAVREKLRLVLGDSKCRLLIPNYVSIGRRIVFMKSAHHDRFIAPEPKAS